MALLPLAASVVAAFFAIQTGRAARRRSNAALGVWCFALAQFVVASAALAWGVGIGWTPTLYRVFYLFGAITNVAWLGLGTLWLLMPRLPWRPWPTSLVIVASLYAAFLTGSLDLASGAAHALATQTIPPPSLVMPSQVRVVSRVFSIAGSLVVLGGLAWSIARRRRHAVGLALIAVGVVIVGVAGELIRAGLVGGFSVGLAAGITVMFVGFVRS